MKTLSDAEATIRRAAAADIDPLVLLYAAFFYEDGIAMGEANIRENLMLMLEDSRACILVAESGDEIVGLSSGSLTFGVEFGCAAELENLYITPRHRGRGLARRLAQAVLDWAHLEGASEIVLVITPEAEAEQSLTGFYEKLGFADSRRITMYYRTR